MNDEIRPSTPQEILDALIQHSNRLTPSSKLAINQFDVLDLGQLAVEDLRSRGYSFHDARAALVEIQATNKVDRLGKLLGIELVFEPNAPYLIPGEGIRRTAGALADDPQTMEELLVELDEIRHPERYVK